MMDGHPIGWMVHSMIVGGNGNVTTEPQRLNYDCCAGSQISYFVKNNSFSIFFVSAPFILSLSSPVFAASRVVLSSNENTNFGSALKTGARSELRFVSSFHLSVLIILLLRVFLCRVEEGFRIVWTGFKPERCRHLSATSLTLLYVRQFSVNSVDYGAAVRPAKKGWLSASLVTLRVTPAPSTVLKKRNLSRIRCVRSFLVLRKFLKISAFTRGSAKIGKICYSTK